MTLDLVALHSSFLADFARFEKLARRLEEGLTTEVASAGVAAVVTARAKQWPNFITKAIKKHHDDPEKHADPLASVRDRAGARLLVQTLPDARRVAALLPELFVEVEPIEDTRLRLDVDQLGYLGIHFQGQLRPDSLGSSERDLEGLDFEVQIHTYAQHAWSEVSHKLLYKPAGRAPEPTVVRRITRAIALAELFDDEIEGARDAIMSSPDYRPAAMLDVLQRQFLQLAPTEFNADLSLEVLRILEGAYSSEELDRFESLMDEFIAPRRKTLRLIFQEYAGDNEIGPFLFQPEALAIFERAVNARYKLTTAWYEASVLPSSIVERLSEVIVA